MKATDEQIAEVFTREQNYTTAAKELGMSRASVERRVLMLKAKGVPLPTPLRDFQRDPEKARAAGRAGAASRLNKSKQEQSGQ